MADPPAPTIDPTSSVASLTVEQLLQVVRAEFKVVAERVTKEVLNSEFKTRLDTELEAENAYQATAANTAAAQHAEQTAQDAGRKAEVAAATAAAAVTVATSISEAAQRSGNVMRVIAGMPKFDGDKAREWAKRMEHHATFHKATNDSLLELVPLLITGDALNWFESLQTVPTTWDDFRAQVVQRFDPLDPSDLAREKLMTLRQTGALASYVRVHENLAQKVNDYPDAARLKDFINGLNKEFGTLAVQRSFTSYEEAKAELLKIDAALRHRDLRDKVAENTKRSQGVGKSQYDRYQQRSLQQRSQQYQQRDNPRSGGGTGAVSNSQQGPDNMQLGAVGNPSKNAKKPQSPGAQEEARKCHICRQPGHFWRQCPMAIEYYGRDRPAPSHIAAIAQGAQAASTAQSHLED